MTIFLTTTVIDATKQLMYEGILGQITTPGQGNVVPGVLWGADNECFLGNYRGDEEFLAWLRKQAPHAEHCKFANAPDVIGDYEQTLRQLQPMASRIRDVGLPASLVAQDGMKPEHIEDRWDEIDSLFLGGTNEYKLGPGGRAMVAAALERGKWVHMGRVNSFRRFQYAHAIGCHSADGTLIAFAPNRNIPKMRQWANALYQMPIEAIDIDAVAGDGKSKDDDAFAMPTTDATPAGARRAAAARQAEREALGPDPEFDPHQLELFEGLDATTTEETEQ